MTIEQLIDDLDADALREVLAFAGYVLPPDTSEKCLRATVLDDYERGYIDGREIRRAVDDRNDLVERVKAANRIICDNNREFARLFAAAAGKAA